MDDLRIIFRQVFDVLTADSHEVLDDSLRLRYQVYCLETEFENKASFVDGRERDRFNVHSLHAVIKHRRCATSIGTVRLVRTAHAGRPVGLPIEAISPNLLRRYGLGDGVLPRCTTAEISRFAISRSFTARRRRLQSP